MNVEMVETSADVRRHELFSDFAEKAARLAMDTLKVPEDSAIDFGNLMADFLAEQWKGQHIYISADTPFKMNKRDLEIYARMERGNASELAKKFHLSFVRIYQIYRRCRAMASKRTQPDLFGVAETELSTGTKAL
jgi:hypothetical protein